MSKVIANRLKKLLPKLFLKIKGGSWKKRQMVDNIILIQEAIHPNRTNGDKGMLINIDMENVFN